MQKYGNVNYMSSEKAYVIINLADVHCGSLPAKELYDQLNKIFLKKLEELPIVDAIIIDGDLCHFKLSMNSPHAKYLAQFISRMIEIVNKKNVKTKKKTKIRVVKGTKSHDELDQLEVLEVFAKNSKCDFRVISTVEEEYLFDDLLVLYIPEEYLDNKDEYYKDYFSTKNKYDMIFGHGLVGEVAFAASKQEGETTLAKAPIFKSDQLLYICRGIVFFGHIHNSQVIKDRIFYVGSFSRYAFGEENEKGFYITTYSPSNGNFLNEFVVNTLAKRFDTVIIDYGSSLFKNSDNQQIEYLTSIVNNLVIDNLRLIINIPEDYPNALLLTNMIHETFSKQMNIKIIINNNAKMRQKRETDEKINLLLTRYGLIFDKSISHEEKISEFIKIKYNKEISVEKIRMYLYEKILKEAI